MIDLVCEQCGKPFQRAPSKAKKARFCSRACQGRWRSAHYGEENSPLYLRIEVCCAFCGNTLKIIPSTFKKGGPFFCNAKCSSQRNRRSIKLNCDNCGAPITRTPATKRENNYCSRECSAAGQAERFRGARNPRYSGGLVEVSCANCGAGLMRPHYRRKKNTNHFCDNDCRGHWMKANGSMRGESNPNWNSTAVPCDNCGAQLYRTQEDLKKNEHNFCDNDCHSSWRVKTGAHARENHHNWKGGMVEVSCDNCGNPLIRRQSELAPNRKCFCDCYCQGEWMNKTGYWTGENNPKWNSIAVPCDNCGKQLYRNVYKRNLQKRHFCDTDCQTEWVIKAGVHAGENHHNWKGGRNSYRGPSWYSQRRRALKRDKNTCQLCGLTAKELGQRPDVHHLTPFHNFGYIPRENERHEIANRLDNLICLCRSCHMRVEADNDIELEVAPAETGDYSDSFIQLAFAFQQ